MSRNCHEGKALTRRDDLESIMYIIIRCINGTLPWYNQTAGPGEDSNDYLLKIKQHYWGPKLCEGLPPIFERFVAIITEMGEDEDPPYDEIIALMMKKDNEQMIMQEQYFIKWNTFIKPNQSKGFFEQRVIDLREKLPRF